MVAAAHVGKVPPSIPSIFDTLGATLRQAGWLLSMVNLTAALGGMALALTVDRLGHRRLVIFGSGLGAAASLGQAANTTNVTLTNNKSGSGTNIGGAPGVGYNLSAAELGRIHSAALTINGSDNDVKLGDLALTAGPSGPFASNGRFSVTDFAGSPLGNSEHPAEISNASAIAKFGSQRWIVMLWTFSDTRILP